MYLLNMVIFHSFLYVYQAGYLKIITSSWPSLGNFADLRIAGGPGPSRGIRGPWFSAGSGLVTSWAYIVRGCKGGILTDISTMMGYIS